MNDSTIIKREGRGAFKYNSPDNLLFIGNWKDNKIMEMGKYMMKKIGWYLMDFLKMIKRMDMEF